MGISVCGKLKNDIDEKKIDDQSWDNAILFYEEVESRKTVNGIQWK